MPGWNFADVWEAVADKLPDAPAQIQGDRSFTWQQFDERADGTAVGWVRITVPDTPVLAGDLRFEMRRDGGSWSVERSESRDHCSRPLTEGECR